MSVNVSQSQSVPLPPTTSVVPTELLTPKTHFKSFLDQAMRNDTQKSRPKIQQVSLSQKNSKLQPAVKSLHAPINPQTPVALLMASASINDFPPGEAQGQPSDTENALPNEAQRSGVGMPAVLAAGQFHPDVVGIHHADANASVPTNALVLPNFPIQKEQNQDKLPVAGKGLTKSSADASPAPQAPWRPSASADTQPVPAPANRPVRNPHSLPIAPRPITNEALEPLEAGALIRPASNEPKQSSPTTQVYLPTQSLPEAHFFQTQDKHLQRAVKEMENLQLNFFSAATSQGGALFPSGLETPKAFTSHKAVEQPPLDPSGGLCQKQAATGLQNTGKDREGSITSATQQDANSLPQSRTAGSSNDSSNEGKSGQNPSAKHSEILESPGPGARSISSNFTSIATSSAVASANALPAPSSQVAASNSSPANAGPSLQPGAPHAAVAEKLTAAVENPLNPACGVVNAASILQTQGKTEMRVALQTESLGPLELHAVLDGGRVGASIAVVNHEAHALLTNSLPALQQVLADQNLRVDHLSVLNTPMNSGTNTGNGGGYHSGGHTQSRPNAPRWTFSASTQVAPGSKDSAVAEALQGRLSVRA